jgi:hypothetical protein
MRKIKFYFLNWLLDYLCFVVEFVEGLIGILTLGWVRRGLYAECLIWEIRFKFKHHLYGSGSNIIPIYKKETKDGTNA